MTPDEKNKKLRVGFFYAAAFSLTGGIEKFNRSFIRALNELEAEGHIHAEIYSAYDTVPDEKYNFQSAFKGFNKQRTNALLHVLRRSRHLDVLILGHINLSIAGWLVKKMNRRCRLIMVTHGIEVWKKLTGSHKAALKIADTILAVSTYTKNQVLLNNNIRPEKIFIFPNTIDPFFAIPSAFSKPGYLLERYGIKESTKIIITLCRLMHSEKGKGYTKVIEVLPAILQKYHDTVYILAGKYDVLEKARIDKIVAQLGIAKKVLFTGFISDNEVHDHFQLADVFIMPSRKEGFGIVFLEAMACGTPVIGGNQDGTTDALLNGRLGTLVNPLDKEEIQSAIENAFDNADQEQSHFRQLKVLDRFGFPDYKQRLKEVLVAK